jgi:hypothetical protein
VYPPLESYPTLGEYPHSPRVYPLSKSYPTPGEYPHPPRVYPLSKSYPTPGEYPHPPRVTKKTQKAIGNIRFQTNYIATPPDPKANNIDCRANESEIKNNAETKS